jgi:hypothetical protein
MDRCSSVKFKPFITIFGNGRFFSELFVRILFIFHSLSFLAFFSFFCPAFIFLMSNALPLLYVDTVIIALPIVVIIFSGVFRTIGSSDEPVPCVRGRWLFLSSWYIFFQLSGYIVISMIIFRSNIFYSVAVVWRK